MLCVINKKSKHMKDYKKLQKPIIFIGTGRSGTTIISEIIHRHPDLAYPSNYQNKFPSHPKVNLIRLLFDNPLWRIFGSKKQLNKLSSLNSYIFKADENYSMWAYLTGDTIDFSRGFLTEESISEERVDFIRSYFNKMVIFQNKNRLSFKITGPSRISFLLKIFPDAIFINLKRKLLPTISSFVKVNFWQSRGAIQLWWTGVYDKKEKEWAIQNSDNPYLLTAFQLKKILQITELELNKYQPKYLDIHYEDFVNNPAKQLQDIINFTNLSFIDIHKYLKGIKIHNRNKKDSDYFTQDHLEKIYQVINTKNT